MMMNVKVVSPNVRQLLLPEREELENIRITNPFSPPFKIKKRIIK